MASKQDGGPAFPQVQVELAEHDAPWGQDGMTLRDYFAAKAMAALIVANDYYQSEEESDVIAQDAYLFADRMLTERSK